MKGSKMSAILAILLMLCGVFAILPLAHSQPIIPIGACTASITTPPPPTPNVSYEWTVSGMPGSTFTADVWVYNISASDPMAGWSVGFFFNPTILQVKSVTNGSVLDPYPAGTYAYVPGSINNTAGYVAVYTWAIYSTSTPPTISAPNAWVDLLHVTFEVNPSLSVSYVSGIAGIPQSMMNFTTVFGSPEELLMIDSASNDITPYGAITNGTITYTLPPPEGPVAKSVISPSTTVTTGTPVTFDASTSTPGWSGVATVPITEYEWNFLNGTILYTPASTPSVTTTYSTPGTYSVNVTVYAWTASNSYNMSSAAETQTVLVVSKPTGCLITLYTQNWRYIDPYYIPTTFVGDESGVLNNTEADTFRPGDLVQLFANATYNGAPVSNALVTFQVFTSQGNTIVLATAVTNCYGVAEWDFRIPWPSDSTTQVNNFTQGSTSLEENTSLFGTWTAYATWQLGSQYTEQPPFEKTQVAAITFDVSWGLSVSIVSVTPNPAYRGPNSCGYGSDVIVKVNVMNEYLEAVPGTLFCTLYDNLLVPIYPTGVLTEEFPTLTSTWSFASISIPSYAFVGTGYVVVNLLSTYPFDQGTAFCPTAWTTLVINAYP